MTGIRLQLLFFFILVLLGGLAARLFQIQVLKGLTYSEMARRQFHKKVKSETVRGEIVDRNGVVLAASIETQSIYAHPKEVNASKGALILLGNTLDMEPNVLRNKMTSSGDFVWIERKVNPAAAQAVSRQNIRGLGMVTEQKRYYPNGSLACHLIGSVGMDNNGLSGIEQTMDSSLRGHQLTLTRLRDGKGRSMSSAFDARDEVPKSAVSLTIDRTLQYYAEKELKAGVEEFQAKSGMILIQDPRTGEILAMASYPHFDPNLLSKGSLPENFNRKWLDNPAVSHLFEPGSTLKVVTFAAALEEKTISPDDMFDCEGGKWKVAGAVINDHEPEGMLTASQVLEKSSNIGTAKVGLKLGAERFYRYVRAFGFGTRTGLPIPGETDGLFREPKKWSAQSLPILSFGQEIGVTAVQLIGAFSAVANGGLLMEPRVIRADKQEPRIVRRVVSTQTCATLNQMMRAVVERGTGGKARVSGYSVCGKTGTAQKIDPRTKKYSDEKYVASFCGFLPAENPALVGLVILDEPMKTYWGGETAAPVFSRVMSRAVTVLDIPPPKAALLVDGVKSTQEVRLLASKSGR